MNIELDEDLRNTVIGAIDFRLRQIADSSEPHHVVEAERLFEATKKMGHELIKDPESGEITVKIG